MNGQVNLFARIYEFLASVRLALTLLITLAVTSIAGTIIPQNLAPLEYLQRYGQGLYSLLYYLDLYDMYHAWWFTLLLGMLVVNLTACSLKRLPSTIKIARTGTGERLKPEFLTRQIFHRELSINGLSENPVSEVEWIIGRLFKKPRRVKAVWGDLLMASKGGYSRFGVYVIHASLVFVLAGAMVGGSFGYKASITLFEGEASSRIETDNHRALELPFQIRLDRFQVKFYPSGQPREFRSDITILEEGREAGKASIRVNHPFKYRGVTFYQHSYGQAAPRELGLKLTRLTDNQTFDISIRPNSPNILPDQSGAFLVLDLKEDYLGQGPAVKLLVRPNRGDPYSVWVNKSGQGRAAQPGLYSFELTRFNLGYYTGLQVNKDPGVWLIYIGFGLILAGSFITFFFSHQKLYAGIIEEGQSVRIILAGSAHRHQDSFKLKGEKIMDHIHKNLAGDSR